MEQHKSIIIAACIITAMLFLHPLCQLSYAQEDEIQRLRQKITKLESRIKHLEKLVNTSPDSGVREKNEQGWENRMNWRRLEIGMSEAQVWKVLGEPIKTIKGVKTLWYYPNIYCGYVSFGKDGLLVGWNEP